MLHRLKKHLIILNTTMTGIILTIVAACTCYLNVLQYEKNSLENYKTLLNTIANKLQTENFIHNNWLSELEIKNKLIIHIEDNGTSFFFKGSWEPNTPREVLIEKAKGKALTEGIDTTIFPLTSEKVISSVFHLKDNQKNSVYASVCILPTERGYKSLTIIQFRPTQYLYIIKQIFLYLGIDFIGIFGLFLVSCYFVKRVLRPVEENQKRHNEFIAAASHDLRSPLAVIQTNASALLLNEKETKRFVPKIIDECKRMSRLISDMLILASADAKSWHIQKEIIDMDTFLIELYDSFLVLCQKRDHSLSMDFKEEALPKIYADKDRLSQVLGILLDNAISYSPEKSEITLRPYILKSTFIIEVEDHGIGITKEEKEPIFERFYRADKSRNDNMHFGLGLSVAKELMELQNGKISVKDTLNGGATFVVELPL